MTSSVPLNPQARDVLIEAGAEAVLARIGGSIGAAGEEVCVGDVGAALDAFLAHFVELLAVLEAAGAIEQAGTTRRWVDGVPGKYGPIFRLSHPPAGSPEDE